MKLVSKKFVPASEMQWRKGSFLFLSLAYLPSLDTHTQKKWLREKQSERKDQYFYSLSWCQRRPSMFEMGSTYGYLPLCFPWTDDRRSQKHIAILNICSGILSWEPIFFDSYLNIWIIYEWKWINQKILINPHGVRQQCPYVHPSSK